MVILEQTGEFKKTTKFLNALTMGNYIPMVLNKYGKIGVDTLRSVTPIETGKTANSWYYEVSKTGNGYELIFKNSNIVDRVSIAVILQFGHGTRNGGYVQGRDYINPAIRHVFDQMATDLWKEVRNNG